MKSPRERRKTWDRKQCKGAEGCQQQEQMLKKWPWTAASRGGLPGYILAGDLRSVHCPLICQWKFLYPPPASSLLPLLQPIRLSTYFPLTDPLKHEWENDPFKASWVPIWRHFLLCVFIYFSFYPLSLFIAVTSASPLAPPPSPSQTPSLPRDHPFHRLGSALICYSLPSPPPPQ